ncbi:hypothetical protein NPIL_483861 [Nephila pilipes]|uniref:Uncharacterized protein n=1 Tax=Nephila pilipes TaxID=299642 RepID=A0A8X6UQY2_NEPPI|nr:hypothetical protein NPIL_483861 [Nephila pilipes]
MEASGEKPHHPDQEIVKQFRKNLSDVLTPTHTDKILMKWLRDFIANSKTLQISSWKCQRPKRLLMNDTMRLRSVQSFKRNSFRSYFISRLHESDSSLVLFFTLLVHPLPEGGGGRSEYYCTGAPSPIGALISIS